MRRLAASAFALGALPLRTVFIGSPSAKPGAHFGHGQIWVARASDPGYCATTHVQPPPRVRIEAIDQEDVYVLLNALALEQNRLLRPKQASRHKALVALRRSPLRLAVVRDAQLQILACGTLALHGGYAEIAQLIVHPLQRGQGLGQLLLAELEAEAIRAGRPLLRVEADVRQQALQRLCERGGLLRCGPFDGRRADPFCVYMEKRLVSRQPHSNRVI